MTLILTLVLLTVALTALFWGLALILQGYLYNEPADKLPLRALVGGLVLATFLSGWTYLNTRATHKDKYGTLFDFNPEAVKEITAFTAVRQGPDGKELPGGIEYTLQRGVSGGRFTDPDGKDFKLNSPDYLVRAIEVPEDGKKARFEAEMEGGRYKAKAEDERRFVEPGTGRYLDGKDPRRMMVPSSGTLALAIGLNVLHFAVWFLVFWPVLRFSAGHALGLAVVFGAVTMFAVMPLLFDRNDPNRRATPAVAQQPAAVSTKQ